MKAAKKIISSVICVSMLASLNGCALFDKDDEGVLAAAEDYAEAVKKGKVRDIVGLMADGRDLEEDIEFYMEGSDAGLPDGYEDVCEAILGTIDYSIDEETVESSKKNEEGSVDITWTMVDYEAVYDQVIDDGGDLEAFIDALEDSSSDTREISQTVEFVLDDEICLVNYSRLSVLFSVYDFYDAAKDFEFIPPLTDYVDHIEWYFSSNDVYTNTDSIELDIIPIDDATEITFEFYYEYYYNGELVYTSGTEYDQGYWIEAYYNQSHVPGLELTPEGYIQPGQYRCIMYDLAGNAIADSTCTVETVSGNASTDFIDYIEWYFSDDDVYTNDTTIELDIIPTSGVGQQIDWVFYYEYYIDGELVFTSDVCTDSGYWIEAYYGPYYDPNAAVTRDGYLISGEYTCIMYDLEGNVLAESTCTVVAN